MKKHFDLAIVVGFYVKYRLAFSRLTEMTPLMHQVPMQCCDVPWMQMHSSRPSHDGILNSNLAASPFSCMYLYFIFVADDARLSEALHRSPVTGTYDLAFFPCCLLTVPKEIRSALLKKSFCAGNQQLGSLALMLTTALIRQMLLASQMLRC